MTRPRISIRKAGRGDAPALAGLFDAYRQFYRQRSDARAAKRFLHDRLKRGESVIFIATIDREPLGFVQLYPAFSSIGLARLWILNDLWVEPRARNKGVADALMRRAQRLAERTRAEGLCLETAVDNKPAQRLYEKLGWKRDEEFFRYNLTLPLRRGPKAA